jgi:hypothetical protein
MYVRLLCNEKNELKCVPSFKDFPFILVQKIFIVQFFEEKAIIAKRPEHKKIFYSKLRICWNLKLCKQWTS